MSKIENHKGLLEHLQTDFDEMCKTLYKKGKRYTSNDILVFGALGSSINALMEIEEEKEEEIEEIRDNIKEELMSAEHYYKKCLETNDLNYKQMAKEELKHADFFIKQARMAAIDTESQKKIQTYLNWYNEISERME